MSLNLPLSIAESIMLIALDDEHGHLPSPALKRMPYTLSACIVFELYLSKHIVLSERELEVRNRTGTGLKILDEGLKSIPKNKALLHKTIQKMAESSGKNFIKITVDMLLARGIIEKKAEHIFGLPIADRLDNANYQFEENIRKETTAVFKENKTDLNASFLVFITMLSCSQLLPEIFLQREEIIAATHHLQDLLQTPGNDVLKKILWKIHHDHLNNANTSA